MDVRLRSNRFEMMTAAERDDDERRLIIFVARFVSSAVSFGIRSHSAPATEAKTWLVGGVAKTVTSLPCGQAVKLLRVVFGAVV